MCDEGKKNSPGEKQKASCMRCRCRCKKAAMLQNECDEYLCKECFRGEFHDVKCTGSTDYQSGDTENYECDTTGKPMFPNVEQYASKEQIQNKYPTFTSPGTISKRPIQCPHPKCNKFIGVLTFESHFKYEHKEVPLVAARLDSRTSLQFRPQDLRYGLKHCICLLHNLCDSDTGVYSPEGVSHSSQDPTNLKPSFILLAAKVASIQLSDDEQHNDLLDEQLSEEESAVFRPGDQAILWMASNIPTGNSYTVALSSLSRQLRIKYYGPVLPLHGHPVDMCEHGKGLVLTYFHYFAMTEQCTKPLSLDVVIHPEE